MPILAPAVRALVVCTLAGALVAACSKDPSVRKQEFLQKGNRYLEAGQYAHAIIEYRNAVQIDPKFGAARARLAEAYAQNGDARRALDEYVRAADLLPKDRELQLQAGTLLLLAGRPQDALARAEIALKLDSKDARAHVLQGNALAGLSSFEKALESIEEAIRLDPKRGATYSQLGAIELVRGRREQAEAAFKRAVAVEPTSVGAHLALGNFYWATNQVEPTEQAFATALKLEPDSQPANRAMAALAIVTGRPERAEQYLKRIAEVSKAPEAEVALAEYYMLMGRPKDAINRLEPLSKQIPDAPIVRQRLARAHASAGDRATAHAIVADLSKKNPRDASVHLIKGQLLAEEGKRDEALSSVRAAVQADPSSVEAHFTLGQLYAVRGDTSGAEAAYREALKLNPRAAAAQVELAKLQIASGRAEESVRTAEEASKADPRSGAARLTLVRSLIAANETDRADRELAVLKRDFPDSAGVHILAGSIAAQRGDVVAARAAFTRAQSLDPSSLESLAGLVALDLQARNFESAKNTIAARLSTGPVTPQLLVLAARVHIATKDPAAAEQAYRQAIAQDATFLPAYSGLGQLYVAQNKLEEARKEFEELARRQSRPVGPLTMSGMILQTQGKASQARDRYNDVLAIDPRAAVAANNLAWMYADAGENLDNALQLAQTATEVMPDVPELMDTLGWVYYKKNLPQLAVPLFARCIEKVPNNPTYHYHLGLALKRAGDAAKARASFERALGHSPDTATASAIRVALTEITGSGTRD